MRLGGIVDMSTIDWPGNVSLVVFFAGCNFRCPYCHNSSLIPLDSGQEIDIDYLRSRIEVGRSLLDSVVLTGGEPLLQPEGVRKAAELAIDLRLKVMLDTNGSRPEIMEDLLVDMLIDRVTLDIKAPLNPQSYSLFRGSLDSEIYRKVKKSLEICDNHGVELEVRTTVAPGVSDGSDFIRAIATELKGKRCIYSLQQFDNLGDVLSPQLKSERSPSRQELIKLADVASSVGVEKVYIKTRKSGFERIR